MRGKIENQMQALFSIPIMQVIMFQILFCSYLEVNGVIRSHSKSRTPHDNAVAESFFAWLKREEIYRREFSSKKDFEEHLLGISSFITAGVLIFLVDYKKMPDKFEEIYYDELNSAG